MHLPIFYDERFQNYSVTWADVVKGKLELWNKKIRITLRSLEYGFLLIFSIALSIQTNLQLYDFGKRYNSEQWVLLNQSIAFMLWRSKGSTEKHQLKTRNYV